MLIESTRIVLATKSANGNWIDPTTSVWLLQRLPIRKFLPHMMSHNSTIIDNLQTRRKQKFHRPRNKKSLDKRMKSRSQQKLFGLIHFSDSHRLLQEVFTFSSFVSSDAVAIRSSCIKRVCQSTDKINWSELCRNVIQLRFGQRSANWARSGFRSTKQKYFEFFRLSRLFCVGKLFAKCVGIDTHELLRDGNWVESWRQSEAPRGSKFVVGVLD